ncbi:uncharacterized protein LOC134535398 [Bacillus rossius redtenbacheri]|uniref:uncharacterized protein LOC134535398 n=1 Tax=Bacillus rossius redtenbacheri TaxID=93214 RepID=UPI002FDC992C
MSRQSFCASDNAAIRLACLCAGQGPSKLIHVRPEELTPSSEKLSEPTSKASSSARLSNTAEGMVLAALLVATLAAAAAGSRLDEYLLPSSVVPLRYELRLAPYLDSGNFTFDGEVTIRVRAAERTSTVTLHRNDTTVDEASVRVSPADSGAALGVVAQDYDAVHHFHRISLNGSLTPGQEYDVHLAYRGHLRDDMQGLFRSSYVDGAGETRWLAATHFQPCRARRAFPSFDEPALKARFKVSIARTPDRRALSNMPVVSVSEPDPKFGGMIWDEFAETPMPLSTYLMAFVVSDFTNLTADSRLSLWQRQDALSQASYGASVSPDILRTLENYTDLHFFLPKMDEVAVPDYQSGATEQWGLVTYRERLILYKEGVSTSSHKQAIALVIAHEFTHMWFGNLVSPKWWSYLWLSEGFAKYFEYFALAEVEPDWRLEEQFVLACVRAALTADSSGSSHPMTVEVADPDEISAIFDTISYQKAASVIRMMKHFVSPETFRRGLTRYLTAVGNSSAEPDDLFAAMDAQLHEDGGDPGVDVKVIMHTWTLQAGYPLLTVTRDYVSGQVTVSQERFLLQPGNGSDAGNSSWWVPLTYTSGSELDFQSTAPRAWLPAGGDSISLALSVAPSDWLLLNVQQTGFYRVNYDERNWRLLAAQLGRVPPVSRAQLLDDSLALARAGRLGYPAALELLRFLEQETDYVPWNSALNGLAFLEKRMRGAPEYHYHAFKTYLLKLLARVYATLGFDEREDDDHVTRLNRNQVVTWVCRLDEWTCVNRSRELFSRHMRDPDSNTIAPDLKQAVYCTALRHGGEAEWQFLWDKFLAHHDVSTEQTLILGVMGCTANETLAHRFMLMSLSRTSGIRQQDLSLVFPSVYNAHEQGVDFAINFLIQYHRNISAFHNSDNAVTSFLSSLASIITRPDQLTKLQQFANGTGSYSGAAGVAWQRSAEQNLAWLSTHGDAVALFARRQQLRLSGALRPESYRLKVRALDDSTFAGEVTAAVVAARPTDRVTLHARDLVLTEASVRAQGRALEVQVTTVDQEAQLLDLKLAESLQPGVRYEVSVRYVGQLRDDLAGFYRSHYEEGGQKRWLATTQFQPTHARKAMPCFDEPALKATFQVTIGRPAGLRSISNAALNFSVADADNATVWDHYEETPAMSTYLLAFAVSDFEKLSSAEGNMSVWVRPGARLQARYALSVSQPLLTALERFAGSAYQLPKMDQLAVPDFSFGAMENWGLVTYRERRLLFDERASTTADRQSIATIIAHEFSHQWFGNLVTMSWWTYPWLNEGFATYCEYFVAAKVMTDWRLEDQFVVQVLQNALAFDALDSSRPMNYEVATPTEISSVFDTITYDKAGSVIRMMEHFITTDVFQNGLKRYLNNRAYDVSEPDQLYASLQAQLNESDTAYINVKEVMDTWTNQKGYPVVTVTRDYEAGTASVKQERFLLKRGSDQHSYKWWVPLSYTSGDKADFQTTVPTAWLGPTQDELVLQSVASSEDWVLFNVQQTGFYRVNYDERNWRLLAAQLAGPGAGRVPPVSRAQLLDDALALARSGRLGYPAALELLRCLEQETDYVPWNSAVWALRFLDGRLQGAPAEDYRLFQAYVLKLLGPAYDSLGFEVRTTDSHATKLLRRSVLSLACELDHGDCVARATGIFSGLMADENTTVAADVASTVYCTALRKGSATEWDFLWARYNASDVSSEQVALLGALGCSADQAVITRYLQMSITEDSGIRKQDAASVFAAVYSNAAGVDLALDFLVDNYERISEFYGAMSSVGNIIVGIAARISTQQQAEKLRSFIETNEAGLGSAALPSRNALETVDENLAWLDTHGATIVVWLAEEASPASSTTTAPSASTSGQLLPHISMLASAAVSMLVHSSSCILC